MLVNVFISKFCTNIEPILLSTGQVGEGGSLFNNSRYLGKGFCCPGSSFHQQDHDSAAGGLPRAGEGSLGYPLPFLLSPNKLRFSPSWIQVIVRLRGWNKGCLLNKGWRWEQEATGPPLLLREKVFWVSREEETRDSSAKVKTELASSVRVRERCLAGSF